MSVEADDQTQAAETAIKDLRSKYARRLDAGEWVGWADVFTEDATVELGGYPALDGRDEVLRFGHDHVEGKYAYGRHTAQMPRIEVNGDTATGEWYLVVFSEMPDGTKGTVTGTYTDEYRVVEGEWKFDRVENETEFDTASGEPHL